LNPILKRKPRVLWIREDGGFRKIAWASSYTMAGVLGA
jgi:hypothetical protein